MNKTILLPIPQKINWQEGTFIFKKQVGIYVDEKFSFDFNFIIGELCSAASTEYIKTPRNNADILFEVNSDFVKEEHEITVTKDRIFILASCAEGVYRAVTTLKQILKQHGEIQCLSIHDKPVLENRAALLDLRTTLPTLKTLKHLSQILADMKYNQFQLYFESFTFFYDNFPEYCDAEQTIKAEEIRELDAFCKERFIELVPYQASFGHMGKWLEKKELKHLSITDESKLEADPNFNLAFDSLNPLDDGSINLMERIYDSILPHFSSEKINIGFDEVFSLGSDKTKEACDKYGRSKVFTDYLNKIYNLLKKKYNKKPMFWCDMIKEHPECWGDIPQDCTAILWGYNPWSMRFDKYAPMIQKSGIDYYVSPGTNTWCNFAGKTTNTLYNIRKAAEAAEDFGAIGMINTLWTNDSYEPLPLTYFGLAVGACYSWNGGANVIAYDETRSKLKLAKPWYPSYITQVIRDNSINYLDKMVFKCKNNFSLADVIFRMGNYEFLDNECLGDSTRCYQIFSTHFGNESLNMQKGYMKDINPIYYKNIARYMQDIVDELNNCKTDDIETKLVIRELKVSCRFTELMARELEIQNYYYNDRIDENLKKMAKALSDELIELQSEFLYTRNARNLSCGDNIYIYHMNANADILKRLAEA